MLDCLPSPPESMDEKLGKQSPLQENLCKQHTEREHLFKQHDMEVSEQHGMDAIDSMSSGTEVPNSQEENKQDYNE
ncbi:hypothetical protein GUJ93_ZPchr0013g35518 [Zizania palustris]|uniref:Uncharacterized protein n=1 Tax=Zizania palustris TaxID=103762 RepID=A0A8J5WVF8_ZIZPA|nr:hypothetical protein GUJ93_ZPchr0013g35518 [Zizania palustris]